jgi:CHAD domain-containing protein
MSFQFAPRRRVAADVRRLLSSQLVAAGTIIADRQDPKAVHDVRVRIKRARALLGLLADNHKARRLEADLREIAARLADAREADAMLEVVDYLHPAATDDVDALSALEDVRAGLLERRAELPVASIDASGIQSDLHKAARRARSLAFERTGFAILHKGLRRGYRAARRAMREAVSEPSGETLHDWRTALKAHLFQMTLLEPAAPAVIGERIKGLEEAGRALGHHRDLGILDDIIAGDPERYGDHASLATVRQLIADTRVALLARASEDAGPLFAARARDHAEEVHELWRGWRHENRRKDHRPGSALLRHSAASSRSLPGRDQQPPARGSVAAPSMAEILVERREAHAGR